MDPGGGCAIPVTRGGRDHGTERQGAAGGMATARYARPIKSADGPAHHRKSLITGILFIYIIFTK